MAVKNKLFSLSSLVIIAVVVLISVTYLNNKNVANMEHEETLVSRDTQSSSKLVSEEKITESEQVVEDIGTEIVKKEEAEKATTKEESNPVEEELGFVPIPGKEIPGIDYTSYIDYSKYNNIAIIGAKQYVNIRSGAGEKYEVVGKIQPNGACTILGFINDTKNIRWAKVQSGDVIGYVKQQFLIKDEKALAMVSSVGRLVIRAKCDELNVRENPTLESKILYRINAGEELDIVAATKDWIQVNVDVGGDSAYISREYVNISFELHKAYRIQKRTYENSTESETTSNLRESLVNYAEGFLGCPYHYGGTSFKTGIDCSAYVQAIYAKYGYKLPRNSAAQSGVGTSIKASQLKPGDLVFYKRGGSIGHVAIYVGNNRIIHASNKRDGIKYSNMYYTTPAKYVRVVNN
ncbi:MAG: hypothetical protein E7262_04040 [Lachnospiraceae bacterium]|nr:hypothetical protein [Lachnospiraceae bacterium]